ncbi:MAG TPA: fibrobacter succinogenes major paralogous domain-containing protein [Cyclobacteriaceae bacterium]|nr:fibrobacter succinogenes major paralogous domain-containing protein [Cyclobacteriaceae bacterium]
MKKTIVLLLLYLSASSSVPAQGDKSDFVIIGQQNWGTKNLAVTTFANGEKIDEAKTNDEWINAGKEKRAAWCYYENKSENGATYGILYNWFAVTDPRGLAPKGWHVPTKNEWKQLISTVGTDGGTKLKNNGKWEAVGGQDRNGTNDYGFAALPGGLRSGPDGKFNALGSRGQFWTSTQNEYRDGFIVYLGINAPVSSGIANKSFGYSVRCMKD